MNAREELLAEAVAVGLILGTDFEKNISNVNLQKKIDEKNAELEAQLKDVDLDTPPTVEELKDMAVALLANPDATVEDEKALFIKAGVEEEKVDSLIEDLLIIDDVATKIKDEKKIDENDNDDVTVQRVSSCGGYRTKIKGLKEAARRSGVSVEQIQEALETGNSVGGYTFTFVG